MLRPKQKMPQKSWQEPSLGNALHGYRHAFIEWTQTTGLSPGTAASRDQNLTYFIRWCDERGLTRPQDITLPILERYQRHVYYYRTVRERPLAASTQQQRLVVLKSFFRWAVRERIMLHNPASELLIPRRPPCLPHTVLTIEQVEAVLAAPDVATPAGLRDRALLETLYTTALRRMEAANVKLADLNIHHGVLRVREGKGRRDRVVPVGARALAWLDKYLADVRPQLIAGNGSEHVFLTDFGEPFEKGRLTDMVKRYLRNAGLKVPGACHLFRHAAATHMLENGADIRFIQAFLGHADLNSTQVYTQVSIRKLKEIHAATHPARIHVNEERDSGDNASAVNPDGGDARQALLEVLAKEQDQEPT